jgi:enoyl-CoA hydratase/carnithine racemase
MAQPIITDIDDVRWITLDRPEIHNALRVEDLHAVEAAVVSAPGEVRGIAITGAGPKSFSTGMHLETFLDVTPEVARERIDAVGDCIGAIRLSPLPTLAVVNGYAIGAAFELILACDLRVGVPDLRVGLPEVKLGVPSVLEAALLTKYVGDLLAREIILTGDLYAVADLPPFSILNRTAPYEQLREVGLELLAKLMAPTAEVMASQKELLELWANVPLQEGLDASRAAFAEMFTHESTLASIRSYRK